MKYMVTYTTCHANCTYEIFPLPDPADLDTCLTCPVCGNLARPDIQVNDEEYDEIKYNRVDAYFAAEAADCVIILGSSLYKSLSAGIVKSAARRGALIIEIGSYC